MRQPCFQDKVVLITGASSGIGLACAQRFQQEGAQVWTAQRRPAPPGFDHILCDLGQPEAAKDCVDQVISETGQLDVLVNNAGMMTEAPFEWLDFDDWQATLSLNLTAPMLLIQHALPYLKKTKGRIINISSIEASGANPHHAAYCASKAGLEGLTRAVAVDVGEMGITCNAVAPGWIDTELNNDFIESQPDPEQFRAQIGQIHPLERTGKPEEVAALVAWLASDEAQFITGQIFTIDGGRTIKLPLPHHEEASNE